MGYLWFWGGCGGSGVGGGVGIFWSALLGVKVVDRRRGAGDARGVQGSEAVGGAMSNS